MIRNQRIKERVYFMWAEAERRRASREEWRRKRQENNNRMRAVRNEGKKKKKYDRRRTWNGPEARPFLKGKDLNCQKVNMQ